MTIFFLFGTAFCCTYIPNMQCPVKPAYQISADNIYDKVKWHGITNFRKKKYPRKSISLTDVIFLSIKHNIHSPVPIVIYFFIFHFKPFYQTHIKIGSCFHCYPVFIVSIVSRLICTGLVKKTLPNRFENYSKLSTWVQKIIVKKHIIIWGPIVGAEKSSITSSAESLASPLKKRCPG